MDLNYVRSLFHFVEFECFLEINEQVYPRFILEFYSKYRLSYSEEGQMFVEFVIQNQYFSLSLEDFAQILRIPCEGACVFSDRWSLDELVYGAPSEGPYQTNPLLPMISSRIFEKIEKVKSLASVIKKKLRPLNPQPLQSHPSLDITLSLLPITPIDHIHDTSSPPSPPQPQSPIMGHPLFYRLTDNQWVQLA
ncbi:hypothetical protein Tco_1371167 [Tanacetum coccineum]